MASGGLLGKRVGSREGKETLAKRKRAMFLASVIFVLIWRSKPAKSALGQFPKFHACHEDKHGTDGKCPFPGDFCMKLSVILKHDVHDDMSRLTLVLEYRSVEAGDVDAREDDYAAQGDCPEKELILPNIFEEREGAL